MARRAAKSAATTEIAAIEGLMSDLETRLGRLSGNARRETSGASADIGAFVSEALLRLRPQFGNGVFKKLTNEVGDHPVILLAVATGIGFLVGVANRR
jgi:hypothetical protein